MMTALLKGAEPYRFLNRIKDNLFVDNAELLKRFCFILRISCKTPNQQLMQLLQQAGGESAKSPASLFLSPKGLGWQAIILCLYENRAKINDEQIAQFTAVLDEWGSQISIHEELPEPAREAGLLALHLLEMLKDSYREENTEKLLGVIIKVVSVIKDEFSSQIEKDVFSPQATKQRNQPSYIRQLLPMALVSSYTSYLCKHVPELIIKLAWHTWFINGDSGYHSSADVDRFFGLHEHREGCNFFPASGLKGPFFHLLREHSGIGLNFIIGLCNRTAAKYAPSELDNEEPLFPLGFTPGVFKIELILNDGTRIKQFCSHRLWSGYRGFSVLPDLLQSALMALENWLIETVEKTETPEEFEILEWLIDYILRQSNSVLTTAVVTSLATGYSEKMGKAILPVLSVLDLFRRDMERMIQERGGNTPNWFSSDDPMRKIYTDERCKAALRPWRNEHMETLITRLQFTELREDIFKILNKFKSIVSELDIDEESINRYRFLLHRIDIRDWKAQEDTENNRIVFSSKELEPDLQEVQQKTLTDQTINSRFIALFLWSDKVFKGEPLERDYFPNWADALVEAKALYELLKNSDVSNLAMGRSSGIVNAAAIFLRDYAQELKEEDIAWCIKTIIDAVLLNANNCDEMAMRDTTGHDGSLAAAQMLPIIFGLIDDEQDVFILKEIIATAITHANITTCEAAADGIRDYMWQHDAGFAQNCLNGAIEYSRLRQKEVEQQRYAHSQAWLSSSETQLEPTGPELSENWLMELREQIATGECVINPREISLTADRTWYLLPAVLIIPDSSDKPEHIALFSKIIAALIDSEKSSKDRRNKNYGHERIPPKFAINFAKRLANYLFSVQEEDARQILDIVLTQIEDAVDLASSLLLNITFIAEKQNAFERYWLFWSWFAETLLPYAMEPKALYQHRSYYSYDSDVIRRLLFANIPWQGVDIEEQALKSGVDLITDFVKKAGINPVVYAAITRLIYYFPMLFKPAVLLEDLAGFQVKQTDTYLLSEGDTVFYLERIMHRFLVQDRKPQPLSSKLRRSCLTLLDAMVETSSSQAYFLREHLLQLRQ